MRVWTARVSYSGPDRVDITAQSSTGPGRALAPTWEMLRRAQRQRDAAANKVARESAWAEYSREYIDLLYQRLGSTDQRAHLVDLLEESETTLVCYCPDPHHCHRRLAAQFLAQEYGCIYLGERSAAGQMGLFQ